MEEPTIKEEMGEAMMLQAQIERFGNYLRRHQLKFTPERRAVLECALSTDSHFQAEDLLIQMRQQGVHVSKATIYRTLPLLVESGLLREVIVGERHIHYEHTLAHQHHDHLICVNCGKIIEFHEPQVEHIQQQICETYGFTMTTHTLEIRGYCAECQHAVPEVED